MSYEWIRRRQRDLSFRYLFPEIAAPWIQCRRGMLRVLWFFTHPVDEFFETLGEIIAWPFVALATLFAWMSTGVREFFGDLLHGIVALFRSLGQLPVWTGSAIAGALGVILTTLLFYPPLIQFRPVTVSISSTAKTVSDRPRQLPIPQPEAHVDDAFDPFAGAGAAPSPQPAWRPEPSPPSLTDLSVHFERLSMPLGWDSRRRTDVVSTSTHLPPAHFGTAGESSFAADGWSLARRERTDDPRQFIPYVSRLGVHSTHTAPRWVRVAEDVDPHSQVDSRRQPAVRISRSAPTTATAGGALKYELIVRNLGTEPLDNVTVREAVSALDRVLDVHPPASVIGDSLVWNITNLMPRAEHRLAIELWPDQLRPVTGGSTVQVTTGVAAVSRIAAPRPQPLIITPEPPEELMVITPPPQTEPPAQHQAPETQDFGLVLPSFDDEPPPFEPQSPAPAPLFSLDSEPAPFPRRPPGILPFAPGDDEPAITPASAIEESEIEAPEGVPIHFEMRTPKLVPRDAPVPAVFEIRNPGPAELTDLVIQVQMTNELRHERGSNLQHRIGRLAAGEVYRTRLTTTAVQDGTARLRSTLTSADDRESHVEATVEVGGRTPSRVSLRPAASGSRRLTCAP